MGGEISYIFLIITYLKKGKKAIVEGHAGRGQVARKSLFEVNSHS
jgi:hypothetical protein